LPRVVEDAQVEIEAGRPVPVLDEHVPEGQRVLAPRHGHEDRLVAREHPVLVDRLRNLLLEELDEVRRAERGIVAPELERGGAPALPALHPPPPDMTGRTSRTSSSPTTVSLVRSSSPGCPCSGRTAGGASAGPGGDGGKDANALTPAGNGVTGAPASLNSLEVSLPVATSARVR